MKQKNKKLGDVDTLKEEVASLKSALLKLKGFRQKHQDEDEMSHIEKELGI